MKIQRRRPSKAKQQEILEGQDHCCFYCFRSFGSYTRLEGCEELIRIHWDHQIPRAYTQSDMEREFVASCQFCNLWKGSRVFDDADAARKYLRQRWASKLTYRKSCEECGEPYKVKRPWQRFCSPSCQFKTWDRAHPRQKIMGTQ